MVIGVCMVLVAVGCANLNTVARTTALPVNDQAGVAIHLDAQQRVVMHHADKYCAEPSPDGLQAYTAALGLSGFRPSQTQHDPAVESGQRTSAANIGLRTQSITLMRDALYRLCEAYHNGAVNETTLAMLLKRSLDQTAAILAIEQLTGAVVANQLILAPTEPDKAAIQHGGTSEVTDGQEQGENLSVKSPTLPHPDQLVRAVAEVADTIEQIVRAAIGREYSLVGCMAFLTGRTSDSSTTIKPIVDICSEILIAAYREEIDLIGPSTQRPSALTTDQADIGREVRMADEEAYKILNNGSEEPNEGISVGAVYYVSRWQWVDMVFPVIESNRRKEETCGLDVGGRLVVKGFSLEREALMQYTAPDEARGTPCDSGTFLFFPLSALTAIN